MDMMKTTRPFLLPLLATAGLSAQEIRFEPGKAVSSSEAAGTFHVMEGFQMQLIAAEPLVTDPVAITYDEDGRAYVCEMNDYPYTDKERHKHAQENPTDLPIGRVRLLTDTDGDGVFDKATVFAEGLSWPTGAACWKGGIFVTATPDVWYLKDTNGDGVADVRKKLFTGFKKLNVQAVMNNPIWGLDHRIYVAGGSNGGEIRRVEGSEDIMPLPKKNKSLAIKRQDFSFDPSTGDVRLESGGARFGNTFDDWGNRFLCNIRNPCQHVVLPYRYLERNPGVLVASALNDCAEAGDQLPVYRTSPPEPWREFRAKRWVQEGSTLPKSELVGAGVVTSSSGITVYRGDAYPKEYRDFAFVADVAGNLFYRMKLVPDGVTFKAVQVDGTKNFCTSDDVWFRPVNFTNAPDGCLHVCDMYREVIEHPWSIPDDIHAVLDLLRGRDRGRIWRLAPASFTGREAPKLSAASTFELVALLDHPNAWHRETAQRLLFERQDKAAIETLRELVTSAKSPQGRVGAFWMLKGLGGFNFEVWRSAIRSDDVRLSQAAVLLMLDEVQLLPKAAQADAVDELQRRCRDGKAQALGLVGALLLAEADTPLSVQGKQGLLQAHDRDAWARRFALEAALKGGIAELLGDSLKPANRTKDNSFLEQVIGHAASSPDLKVVAEVMGIVSAFGKGYQDDYLTLSQAEGRKWVAAAVAGASTRGVKLKSLALSDKAMDWWNDQMKAVDALTLQAVQTLSLGTWEESSGLLLRSLKPHVEAEIQTAALTALGSYTEPAVADRLIGLWANLSPALREKAMTLLLSRRERIAKLLDAIEAKKITPAQISAAAKATLGRQKDPALAARIAKVLQTSSGSRAEVLARYQTSLTLTGDPARGAKVYETACMVCHKHADRGNDVGPHLGTIKAWTGEQVLTNILDPNREVSPNFALYIVETNDGRTLSGLIASETAGNLTLKRADGGTDQITRGEIKSMTSPGISLMPEGLEAAITPEQMADLLAFLRQ